MRLALGTLTAAALLAGGAAADSINPVRLGIHVAPIARLHKRLSVRVAVTADPGALDDRLAPLQIEVRLAPECGGDFQHTRGVALLDKPLKPQPATGRAYDVRVTGQGRPQSRGRKTVCTYLEESGDDRVWAHDESLKVKVVR